MPVSALVAQLRYIAERLNALPLPTQSRADRKVLRTLLASTLDTLHQLSLAQPAQPRPEQQWQSPLYRSLHQLRVLERELLMVSPGQETPPILWATLQQTLSTLLAEMVTTYRYA